jgi:hypothetical protein
MGFLDGYKTYIVGVLFALVTFLEVMSYITPEQAQQLREFLFGLGIQPFDYTKADNGDGTTFDALPMSQLDTIQVLSIRTDAVATVRLDGQSDAGIVLAAGGAIDLIDVTIDAGAGASNASANANGTTPQLRGFGGGT